MTKQVSEIQAKIPKNIKEQAEQILFRLGLTPSTAIRLFYQQIIYQKALPFKVKLPTPIKEPTSFSQLKDHQVDVALMQGLSALARSHAYTIAEVSAELKRKFDND